MSYIGFEVYGCAGFRFMVSDFYLGIGAKVLRGKRSLLQPCTAACVELCACDLGFLTRGSLFRV